MTGHIPFQEWFEHLKDRHGRARITARLTRLQAGLLGQTNRIGSGVHELKIDTGPGYRVYFANDGADIVILLVGGSKRTQAKDIKLAQTYWSDYKLRKKGLRS